MEVPPGGLTPDYENVYIHISGKLHCFSRWAPQGALPINKFELCVTVPDHVTFLNQVTYSGTLVQTELPIERKPNQITFG